MSANLDYKLGENFPKYVEYFKEDIINEILTIPNTKPKIKKILKNLVDIVIDEKKIIETQKMFSNEGQILTGYKIMTKLRIKEKLTYITDEDVQNMCVIHYQTVKTIFITVPKVINNENIYNLFTQGRLQITPYIECIEGRIINSSSIHKCVV